MGRTVVAIDPAVTATEDSDQHGIMVCGIGPDQVGYVVEVNQGGDMVAHTLRTIAPNLNVIEVRATRGKHVRAEPIAALYEQGRVRHVGRFDDLEAQMTQMTVEGYQGEGSPDRVDALVWAMSELFPDMVDTVPNAQRFNIKRRAGGGWLRS